MGPIGKGYKVLHKVEAMMYPLIDNRYRVHGYCEKFEKEASNKNFPCPPGTKPVYEIFGLKGRTYILGS